MNSDFLTLISKPCLEMCFSSSRETNRANFQAKFFPTVSNVIHCHIVDWKSVCLRSVHFYDRFTPGSIFNLKARIIRSNKMMKETIATERNYCNFKNWQVSRNVNKNWFKYLTSIYFLCTITYMGDVNFAGYWSSSFSLVLIDRGQYPAVFYG